VSVYLSDTFRSQSFSLSQRFHPSESLRLCFKPHPPLGFDLQSFSRPVSRHPSRGRVLSCRCTVGAQANLQASGTRLQSFHPTEQSTLAERV